MMRLKKALEILKPSKIFFCAGARNASLLEACQDYPLEYAVDERSAAFSALGVAKLSGRTAVVCTTSGTAVAECLPAMIEAYYSGEKLVVLSADRPQRLYETYAPQTIKQDLVLKDFCRSYFNGRLCDLENISQNYPMHLNFHIDHLVEDYCGDTSEISFESFKDLMKDAKKVVAIFTDSHQNFDKELTLLNKLDVPIYRELTYRGEQVKINHEIRYEKDLEHMFHQGRIEIILKFGKTPYCKLWRLLDTKEHKVEVISYKNNKIGLPYGKILKEDLQSFEWQREKTIYDTDIGPLIQDYPESEIGLFQKVSDCITADDIVFVGNSMPIRYWQMLHRTDVKTYASRGANGIDGQLATALAMAKEVNQTVHCILGDLTFLYDLSSCFIDWPKNFFLHLINNRGGRIFERISVPKELVLSHDRSFSELLYFAGKDEQSREYLVDNEATRAFWSAWNI